MANKKSQSLWSDAWRRLRKNKFAMVGLIIVVLVSLSAIFAPYLTQYQADYGQPWLRSQPPGFSHPAVLAELRFEVGKPAAVPKEVPELCAEIMSTDGDLAYRFREFTEQTYRLKLRKGKIREIKQGARKVKSVKIQGDMEYLELLHATDAPKFRDITLTQRKPLPEELAPGLTADGKILLVKVRQPATAEAETAKITIADGKVTAIARGDQSLESLSIDGRYVLETTKNGESQRLHHTLGTDLSGRDVLSRVIYGGRISLMVGAIATIVSVLIGVIYGAFAGYLAHSPLTRWHVIVLIITLLAGIGTTYWAVSSDSSENVRDAQATADTDPPPPVASATPDEKDRSFDWRPLLTWLFGAAHILIGLPLLLGRLGRVLPAWFGRPVTTKGEFMMRIVDILNALPFMFLVILLMVSFGRDIFTLFFALGAVQWLTIARIVRGQVLSLKEKEFVEAAEMSGSGHAKIVFSHLIPNTLGIVIVYATLTIPAVILQESFLAFIGLTVEFQGRALDSWGSLVNLGRQALTDDGGNWWILIFPSLAMAITLFSLNFFGDGLRDALDPKLKGKS